MNGKERLIWAENAEGYIYLTTFESPLKPGFQRFSTTTPSEMDRIWAKLDKQEQRTYARMTEQIYIERREFIETNLSNLRTRLANSTSAAERDVIRAWMTAFENKMDKLLKHTVYGVAQMQREAAPIPVENKSVSVEEIRAMKPVSEAIQ